MPAGEVEIGTALVGTAPEEQHQLARQHGGEVTDLIKMAMDKDVDVAVLERLVALKERIMDRDARLSYMNALAAFQRECPVILKDAEVKYTTKSGGTVSYTYAPLPMICKQINPILEKHGLSYSWTTKESQHAKVLMVVCRMKHVDGHSEESEFPVPTENEAAMSPAQRLGAALTYGRRQSLVSVLGIVTADEDDDAVSGDQKKGGILTPEQIEQLNKKVDEVGADFPRFMKYMGHEDSGLDAIPASDFDRAMRTLDGMRQPAPKPQARR